MEEIVDHRSGGTELQPLPYTLGQNELGLVHNPKWNGNVKPENLLKGNMGHYLCKHGVRSHF